MTSKTPTTPHDHVDAETAASPFRGFLLTASLFVLAMIAARELGTDHTDDGFEKAQAMVEWGLAPATALGVLAAVVAWLIGQFLRSRRITHFAVNLLLTTLLSAAMCAAPLTLLLLASAGQQ